MKNNQKLKLIARRSFKVGLLFKGIDGVLEIIGGILLFFMNPATMNRLAKVLTQHELSEDPKDVIANYIIEFSKNISISTQHFGVVYLLSHGIIKCIIVILLFRRTVWAYPVMIIFLAAFIGYQSYRYIISGSVILLVLTLLDFIILVLTVMEYRRMKR